MDAKCTVCGKPEKYETHGPAGCVIELRRQRDQWAHQCNLASEAQADATSTIATLTSRAEEAEAKLAEVQRVSDGYARGWQEAVDAGNAARANLTRAIRYVDGDSIEDVMGALKAGANLAIDHETTVRLLDAAVTRAAEASDRAADAERVVERSRTALACAAELLDDEPHLRTFDQRRRAVLTDRLRSALVVMPLTFDDCLDMATAEEGGRERANAERLALEAVARAAEDLINALDSAKCGIGAREDELRDMLGALREARR